MKTQTQTQTQTQTLFHRYRQLTVCALLAAAMMPAAFAQDATLRNGRLTETAASATANIGANIGANISENAPVQQLAQAAQAAMPPASAAASPVQTEAPAQDEMYRAVQVGDVTRTLLQAQVDGRVAAPRLPILGITATASWQRYLDSFKHPLPEKFEKKVTSN